MENSIKKYSGFKLYLPVIMALILILGFLLGVHLNVRTHQAENKFLRIGIDRSNQLNNIIDYILSSYVDSVDRQQLTEDAIHSLLRNLDPHSAFIPERDFSAMNDPLMGGFEGIGIEFNMISDSVVVINPIAGGPSQKAGIMPGDRIVSVNGESISGANMPTGEVVSRLRGEKGTSIEVKVFRPGVLHLLPFTLVRDRIPQYSLDVAYMIDDQTGYIRLNKFSVTTHPEFLQAMDRLKGEGMKRLVLDLRGNGGGFLEASINLADEFLPEGKLMVYTDGLNRRRNDFVSRSGGSFETQPLVILIDEWSASASEIVAGAVQDHDRAVIVGRRSFGKGLVQEQVQLADGSALRLTVARYYTPTGRSIQRPYHNGDEEYMQDFLARMLETDTPISDTVNLKDSQRFETPGGRVVFGGGGITPDVIIPIESGEQFLFFNQAVNQGLINRFAFQYADQNRSTLQQFETPSEFVSRFNLSTALYRNFLRFARTEGLEVPQRVNPVSEELIRLNLKALIGRNIFGMEAFFPVIHQKDNVFLKGLEILNSDRYNALLMPVQQP
ncbi:MAG TPA: S41 family peptidase [Bacteroidales bacterium]|nr:S41 family peptidase [Bacteroidales bacterium]